VTVGFRQLLAGLVQRYLWPRQGGLQ